MAKGRLVRPNFRDTSNTNQAINVAQVIENIYKTNPELFPDKIENLSQDQLNELANQILDKLGQTTEFNKVLSEDVFKKTDESFEEAQVQALRKKNREELAKVSKELKDIEKKLEKEVNALPFYQDYDLESDSQVSVMSLYFPDHTPGRIRYSEYLFLKKQRDLLNELKADRKKNKSTRKLKRSANADAFKDMEIVDFNKKYNTLMKDAYDHKLKNLQKKKAKNPANSNIDDAINSLQETYEDFKKGELSETKIDEFLFQSTDLGFSLSDIIGEWDENKSSLDPKQTGEVGLIPIYEETVTNRSAVDEVTALISSADEQNSAISLLMGTTGDKVKIATVRGKKREYDKLLLSCFSCFKGAWSLPLDFKFGLAFELDTSKFIATINDVIKKIKYAIDLPYLVKQNFCSLVRLGALCPLELAFLIAAAVSNVIFAWQEVFSKFPDFLQQLAVSGILKPLLNMMQFSLRASASPWPHYQACVFDSLKGIQDIDAITGRYGWTVEDAYRKSLEGTDSIFLKKLADAAKNPDSNFNQNIIDTAKAGLSDLATATGNDDKFLQLIASPFFGNVIDPLEMTKAIAQDAGSKLIGLSDSVRSFISGTDAFLRKNSISRLELCAKISALTAFIGIAVGILDFMIQSEKSAIRICVPMEAEIDGETVTTQESPWTPKEIAKIVNGSLGFIENGVPNMPPETVTPESRLDDQIYIYNPITDRRFNITNCNKAKSSIISKGESLEFWKRIALGDDISDV